jgi:hypothetical protein
MAPSQDGTMEHLATIELEAANRRTTIPVASYI